jgi:DNA-binding NtrC family response regulator
VAQAQHGMLFLDEVNTLSPRGQVTLLRFLQDLRYVLASARGNVTIAARMAGKERRSFGKLLKKHSIDKSRFRS